VVWLGEAIAYRVFTGRIWPPLPWSWKLVFIAGFIGYLGVTQVVAWFGL
jgi:hypothetical protein